MATLTLPQQWAASPSSKPHWAEPRTTTPRERRREISRGSSMSDLPGLEQLRGSPTPDTDFGTTPAHTSSGLDFEDNPVKRPPRRSSTVVGPGRGPQAPSPSSRTPSGRPQSARISRQQLDKGARRSSSTHRTGRGDTDKSTKYRRSQSLGRTSSTSSIGTAPLSSGAPLQSSRSSGGIASSMQHDARAAKLILYHVRRPEPRARWVFNSSHGGKRTAADFAPHTAPTRVTSTVDESRPSLGGLVWINATLGGHCCLEKGTKTKTVTDVPIQTLDGWLNGQTGIWWLGALKEGHRTMWDGHVVMSWAMVFIPAYPELAAKNNMEVWKDKCLKGSRRVARAGELARRIADIVADDEDAEPESVVHTHLCILLAEGDDLDLKRTRMQGTGTPRAGASGGFTPGSSIDAGIPQSMASRNGSMDMGAGVPPRPRDSHESGVGATPDEAGGMTLEEALERVEKYRDRIRALKEDRQAKKATLARLEDDLRRKEDLFARENDRLRQERNDLRARAKLLRMDVEDLKREANSGVSVEHVEQLRFDVDRLRRERDDARAEAMRWLEQEKSKLEANAQATALAEVHKQRSAAAAAGSSQEISPTGVELGIVADGNGKRDNSAKAAAAIAKLRAKVERLRKERDEAEEQAAKWLNEQQANLRQQLAADMSMNGGMMNEQVHSQEGADSSIGGPIMASLQAESARLRKELEASRNEAKMLRERAPADGSFSKKDLGDLGGNGLTSLSLPQSNGTSVDPEDAKKALSHLLGKALNLLSPQAAAEAAAEVAATAAANAEAASNGRGQTRLQKASKEEDMTSAQTWARMAAGDGDSDSGSSTVHNSPPVKTKTAALTPRMVV